MKEGHEELISVIVPVYNAEKYLDRCLSSLVEQSYGKLEILLINDGSTDCSAQICENWKQKDFRIRFYSQENQGVSAARNLGLEKATGDYVAFVDADDWIDRKMLEKQAKCLEKEGSDIVLCGFVEIYGKNSENISEAVLKTENTGNLASFQKTSSAQYLTMDVKTYAGEYLLQGHNRCWSVLFRREAIGQVRFVKGLTIGEDLLFMMDLLPRIYRVSVMEDQDYFYFINESGAMMAEFRAKYMDQITCWELAAERVKNLWPEYLPLIQVCQFQAALLVAGKLALVSDLSDGMIENYLERCCVAARESWHSLGTKGRRRLSAGYRAKGAVFLNAPRLYLKMYHVWKGMK